MSDKKDLNRRSFIKSAALGAGALAFGGVIISSPKAEAAVKEGKWDRTVDVVVVGYGGAGAAAAIAAADAKAKVLILEKGESGGGSTYYSGGFFVSPKDTAGAVKYLMSCARAADDKTFDLDEEILTGWAKEAGQNEVWFSSLGVNDLFQSLKGWYPDFDGADAYTSYQIKSNPSGVGLWQVLSKAVESRKIEVLYKSPGTELVITRPKTDAAEVLGIIAGEGKGAKAIRARKGVILTTGGFDYDEKMKKDYLFPYPTYSVGHPGNTGDAIKIAAKTGADLWHMNSLPAVLCYKFSDVVAYPSMLQLQAAGIAFILVNKYGKRFINEAMTYDAVAKGLYTYDPARKEFPNIPSWSIFDEKTRAKVPAGVGLPMGKPIFTWSKDNSEELAKGWIMKGGTIEELAGKIGMDPKVLAATVSNYNQNCAQEVDPDFSRKRGLIPIDQAPFYAIKGYPGHWATGGGPRINIRAQVLDTNGNVVKRLYTAGSASTLAVAFLYPLSGTAIGDCFAMGRIAGRNAAAEKNLK